MILIISLIIVLIFFVILTLSWWKKIEGKCSIEPGGGVLLITAHPDDECMFFSPTILALERKRQPVYLLCLTDGNYYGLGSIRRQELYKSAQSLGIGADRVILHSDERLPDDPTSNWDQGVVNDVLANVVSMHSIKLIITFDDKGVSGHPNHIAICTALRSGHRAGSSMEVAPAVLFLETTGVLRKYLGVLDLFPTLSLSSHYAVNTMSGYLQARKAMACHRSQYVWFRRLYVCCSRYMIVNSFKKCEGGRCRPGKT